ncbi:MAG: DUF2845 domain-containing protein [Gammaproteobacteria bacterium]
MRLHVPVLVAFACAASVDFADAREMFRCNGSIVRTGQTIPEVLARCGEPDSRESAAVPVRAIGRLGGSYVVGTATVEYWVYRRRGGQFPAYLTFDQGRLRKIELIYYR